MKNFKFFFISLLLLIIPIKSYSQDKTLEMLNSINTTMNRVSDSIGFVTSELKDLKKTVEILTQKVIVIESDYTSFKKTDWPQNVTKLESLGTVVTTLSTDFYNLKSIVIPDIINKTEKLKEKYDTIDKRADELDISQNKTNTSYNIVIAILGAIATAILTIFLNKKFGNSKENE